MLSRVAESIFWMARYIERAENVARFIDANFNLTLDLGEELGDQWAPLVYTTGDQEPFFKRFGQGTRDNVLHFLAFDAENPNSILSCLTRARENARTAREIISSDMWEELNRFYLLVREAVREGSKSDHDFFAQIKRASHVLIGTTDTTMSHGEAWHFARMGRLLERADKTSRIVDVKYFILLPELSDVGSPYDDIHWGALLKSTSAFEMYRKRFGRIVPERVVDFLLFDRQFPRTLSYCVVKGERSLHAITRTPLDGGTTSAERLMAEIRKDLARGNLREIMASGLHEYLDGFQTR